MEEKRGIDSFTLHILAMLFMLCDHLWATLFPAQEWMTCVGRLAFPIFAFMIAEGCYYTSNVKKYMLRLRGKGVPDVNGYGRGDLLVVVNIHVPASVNASEKQLLEKLAENDHFKKAEQSRDMNIFDRMRSFFR